MTLAGGEWATNESGKQREDEAQVHLAHRSQWKMKSKYPELTHTIIRGLLHVHTTCLICRCVQATDRELVSDIVLRSFRDITTRRVLVRGMLEEAVSPRFIICTDEFWHGAERSSCLMTKALSVRSRSFSHSYLRTEKELRNLAHHPTLSPSTSRTEPHHVVENKQMAANKSFVDGASRMICRISTAQ